MPEVIDPAAIEEYGKKLSIEDLLLDSENPRLYAQRRSGDLDGLQAQIYDDLMKKISCSGPQEKYSGEWD